MLNEIALATVAMATEGCMEVRIFSGLLIIEDTRVERTTRAETGADG